MNKKIITALLILATAGSVMLMSGCGSETKDTSSSGEISITDETERSTDSAQEVSTEATTVKAEETTSKVEETTAKPTEAATTSKPKTESKAESKSSSQSSSKAQQSSKNATSSTNSSSRTQTSTASSKAESQKPTSNGFTSDDVVFTKNGKKINLGDKMTNVIAAFGNASSVSSAPSCHGVGEDKTYVYSDFTVYTCPDGSNDKVIEVEITSTSLATQKGIKIGASETDVISAYGNNYQKSGYYIVYDAGGSKSLQFFIMDGVVEEIGYFYDV